MEGPFRRPLPHGLTIIETLRLDSGGAVRGARHLDRMERTAAALAIPFDRKEAENLLERAGSVHPLRARLSLDEGGALGLACSVIPDTQAVWRLRWADARIGSGDPWRRVKTSMRAVYDTARAGMAEGTDELLFLNERGEVAEGTITNLFIGTPKGLLTPPVSAGALPGILRQELIASGRASEARLLPENLMGAAIFVGNSLRGLVPARLA
jgi:4-amino-4-deoxychorismate lyase